MIELIWHYRLGHLSPQRLQLLHKQFPYINCPNFDICDICQFAKQKRLSFSPSIHNVTHIFYLIHFDIWGPFNITSIHGHKYFLTVLDDYSRFTWIFFC